LIDLTVNEEILKKAVERAKERASSFRHLNR